MVPEACICPLHLFHVLFHLHTLRLPTAVGQVRVIHTSYSEWVPLQQLDGVKE